MNRALAIMVSAILIAAGAWCLIASRPAPAAPSANASLSQDLYPLYPGATWFAPASDSVLIGTTTYAGVRATSEPIGHTADPSAVFAPFQAYYDQKLKSLGYSVANDLAAGGHTGGQTGYRKGNAVALVSFSIEYLTKPERAPSECPCDVSLSVFSTNSR